MASANETQLNKTSQDDGPQQANYKEQLDRTADESRAASQPKPSHPLVEKLVEYVPAASKIVGTNGKQEQANKDEQKPPGPPERPHHDVSIEEFVRDQHRSKAGDSKVDDNDN